MNFSDSLAHWLITSGPRIVIIGVLAYVLTRITASAARRFEGRLGQGGSGLEPIERSRRVQTLVRIVHKAFSVLLMGMAVLMILRELDVDITPVLTGAGIAGLAMGFGAQTLVRDVISGFFLLLEDQVRVGDSAVVNGQGGVVEEINIRTIVLRDAEGALHIFPNGEVKTLANKSRDFSYYVMDVGIRSDADADRVIGVLHEAGAIVAQHDRLRHSILAPMEVEGIDAFSGNQLIVKVRIKTLPQKQVEVGRELRKTIARLFAERGIELPSPRMDVHIQA